jgi:anionic cell wall polymer biosynthesis LytR-Cps2A-Psr (LCP) family protein
MVEVIDALGGLDLEITQAEMNQINKYKNDVDKVTGKSTPNMTEYGLVHLDGTQATTYARIRKLTGDDFKRASRQRIVLQAILEKAKKADLATLTSICNSVVDDISTTLSLTQILSLAKDVTSYKISSTTGFPFELTTKSMPVMGDTVIPADLATNVQELHEYMFDDVNYVPSQTVQTISDTIVNNTGITTNSALINTGDYNETAGATGTDSIQKSTQE